jgi:hypothetical protein
MAEADVWRDALELNYLQQNTRFEIVNVLE